MQTIHIRQRLSRYSPAIFFLGEYTNTMAPVAKAIDILQGESIHMGWLLPTIITLIAKLERARVSLRFCKPLVDAQLDGLKKRFRKIMCDPEMVAAAILHPKFKHPGPVMRMSSSKASVTSKDNFLTMMSLCGSLLLTHQVLLMKRISSPA